MNTNPEIPVGEPNILDDVHYTLYQATSGKRFVNYLIDWLGFYLVWRLLLIQVLAQLLFLINFPVEDRLALYAFSYLAVATVFGLVVGGVEAATGGKTLGKLITGTRAVNEDGSRISA